MKNQEIIAKAAVQAGLLPADEAKRMIEAGEDIPMHTLQGWKLRGNYHVKEDAEPLEVKLWKRQEEVKRIGLEEEDRKWQSRNKHEEDN